MKRGENTLEGLYNESCRDTIKRMSRRNIIDLTVTSPPYNVGLAYDGYDDRIEFDEYMTFLSEVFYDIWEVTKDGGRLAINIGDGKNGSIPIYAMLMDRLKFTWKPITTIIWEKGNTSNRCAWGSWMSPSCPSFPRNFEYIGVWGKNSKKLRGRGESDLTKEEFVEWASGLWRFPGAAKPKVKLEGGATVEHPAAFPIELPRRAIKMLSWKGALVYDPFMGSGTTALAAIQTGRRWLGSEISPDYVELAKSRICAEEAEKKEKEEEHNEDSKICG